MLKGSIVALVTPFEKDGKVNYQRLGELIEWHIENKTDGIVILGTTGEATTLTEEERKEVVIYSVEKAGGRIPIIVGAGSNNTEESIKKAKLYSSLGADYLLVITPYYNKTNEPGLISHFELIAKASSCPIIMYNVPSRTGMNISVHAVEVLSKNKNIVGIKEASGNMSYAVKIAKYLNEDFAMYSGNDDIIVPMLSIGGAGVISVLANICPKQTHDMCEAAFTGDYEKARELQLKYLDFINDLFLETNPIPVKAAMNYLGLNAGGYRMPLFEMSEAPKNVLFTEIEKLKKDGDIQ